MKHDLEGLLRSEARRELREAPAGIPEAVRARLDHVPELSIRRARFVPFALAAGLAAAALCAYTFWPREQAPAPARPSTPALAVDLTRRGLQYAARMDRPLADEWQLLVADSLQLRDALLGALPNLPR
jgi:hypothetical protein